MDSTLSNPSAPASVHTASTTVSRPSSSSSAPPLSPTETLPPGAPKSALFEIRHTATAGRAVFATQDIPENTLIWRSNDLTINVLLREYRREVCGQCFGYDYGRDLEIRDKSVGFAFCGEECQEKWKTENEDVGVRAWTAVEKLVKGRSKEDSEMMEPDLPRPKKREIEKAWESVKAQGEVIRAAREAEMKAGIDDAPKVTKQHRKAISKALQAQISPDVMSFCVSTVLWRHNSPEEWENVLALAIDSTPYTCADDLAAFTRSYLHLLAILPVSLLPLVTSELFYLVPSRDSHNSFGIRSLEDDGSEFFGYGCWPSASYFNHSCGPNIEKKREGRVWEFRAGRDIEKGDELCITYLSGEERKLSRGKRMMTLKRNWGFECMCDRCEPVL